MKIVLFGATGMVGQGVLRECLLASDVDLVAAVGRTASGVQQPKLREIAPRDMWDYGSIEAELTGFDACFFCLGVTSAGMKEADYEHVTSGIALAAAETLARLNPGMTFIYVSGSGTDGSEKGPVAWARIKGRTENALMRLPFKGAYMFRPGIIQPLHGARSKTALYRVLYVIAKPLLSPLRGLFPTSILTTEQMGLAMLEIARHGPSKRILETRDIAALARAG
jgi:uncharacterized protein YbjT (DUF2867 family)